MTLDGLRPIAERVLDPFVDAVDRVGLTPDGISVLAFVFAVAAGIAYGFAGGAYTDARPGLYAVGTVFVALNGWCDLLDGALARLQGSQSKRGDLLDHVVDRYADIIIVGGLAAGLGRFGLGFLAITGVLMTSYLGTQAQAVGLERVYGGLVGRADRLAIIGIVTAIASLFAGSLSGLTLVGWLLVFLAAIGHLTALQRFYGALGDL